MFNYIRKESLSLRANILDIIKIKSRNVLSTVFHQENGKSARKNSTISSDDHRSRGSELKHSPWLRKVAVSKRIHQRAPTIKADTHNQLITWLSVPEGCVSLIEGSHAPDNMSCAVWLLSHNFPLGKH